MRTAVTGQPYSRSSTWRMEPADSGSVGSSQAMATRGAAMIVALFEPMLGPLETQEVASGVTWAPLPAARRRMCSSRSSGEPARVTMKVPPG
ncbi:hypothetical protein D3C73_1113770 [compost metagenome]